MDSIASLLITSLLSCYLARPLRERMSSALMRLKVLVSLVSHPFLMGRMRRGEEEGKVGPGGDYGRAIYKKNWLAGQCTSKTLELVGSRK